MKLCFALILITLLQACSIFGNPTAAKDETRGWNDGQLSNQAEEAMMKSDYEKAIRYYSVLQARYPYGASALHAAMQSAYAYYKKGDSYSALATADRFIKQHPHHPNVDYMYYLKGLASFGERTIIDRFTDQEISDRDPQALQNSFVAFKELVTKFPDSKYTPDATERMGYLVNVLGEYEIYVAHYYYNRRAYVAAVNRCKYVMENYPTSPATKYALAIMIQSYEQLGITDLREDALRVFQATYPGEDFKAFAQPPQRESFWKQDWWKIW